MSYIFCVSTICDDQQGGMMVFTDTLKGQYPPHFANQKPGLVSRLKGLGTTHIVPIPLSTTIIPQYQGKGHREIVAPGRADRLENQKT